MSVPDTTDTVTAVHSGLYVLERAGRKLPWYVWWDSLGLGVFGLLGISVAALIGASRKGPGDWMFWGGLGVGGVGAVLFVASVVWLLTHRVRHEPDSSTR